MLTIPGYIIGLAVVLLAMVAAVLLRRFAPLGGPVAQPLLFHDPPPPAPLEPLLTTRIGGVVSDGMDRVEAMRAFGADRFLTFMPMPDGTCWSLTVVHHPSEEAAKASYSRRPEVTH